VNADDPGGLRGFLHEFERTRFQRQSHHAIRAILADRRCSNQATVDLRGSEKEHGRFSGLESIAARNVRNRVGAED
jgi:hypothetical protein